MGLPLPWNKTKRRKKVLGGFTFWVTGYFPFGMAFIALLVIGPILFILYFCKLNNANPAPYMLPFVILFFCIHLGTGILSFVLLVIYMIDALMNPKIRETPKILWALAVFFGSYFANVFYWYLYVWRDPLFTLPSILSSAVNMQQRTQMSTGKKIGLGIITIIPLLNFILMIITFISLFVTMILMGNGGHGNEPPPLFFVFMISIFVLAILGIIFVWCLLIYYVRSIFKNSKLSDEKKELWVSILMFGRSFTLPFYWYWYVGNCWYGC